MSLLRQVIVRDLVEEAKKRIVFLVICVVGLSYLMSLTSSSVLVNLPAAASLIVILRYIMLDFEMKRKAATYSRKSSSTNPLSSKKPLKFSKAVDNSEWRAKVNSPVVEDAIDHFSRRIISEWMTNLWYSRLTPDREGPDELAYILNSAIGEISGRMRNINLIDLLTRDLINLVCKHLENFRAALAKIDKQQSGSLTIEHRDKELRLILVSENKLHPALFSAEAEHKVLQHIMDGLVSFTFKPEDLQCTFFRYIARELLACAVMRPVVNLASPRFINERIESVVVNRIKAKEATTSQGASHPREDGPKKISSDYVPRILDPSVTGVELVQLKNSQSGTAAETVEERDSNLPRDPLLSVDACSSHSWKSLPSNSQASDDRNILRHHSGGEWGDVLDAVSRRKTQALAPEHFENMWTKGRNYRKKEGENRLIEQVPQRPSAGRSLAVDHAKLKSRVKDKETVPELKPPKDAGFNAGMTTQFKAEENSASHTGRNRTSYSSVSLCQEDEQSHIQEEDDDSGSSTLYTSEDENTVTGLDSPVKKVWDRKSNRKNQAVSHIHHPLECSDFHILKKTSKGHIHHRRLHKTQSWQERSGPSGQNVHVWQEIERTALGGYGQSLGSSKGHVNSHDSRDDPNMENLGRIYSGAAASSSTSSICVTESRSSIATSLKSSLAVDSFFKLRCEVLGANIVKSGSVTFAVYSISVTDVNKNNWSIKRRFRHFEELHRRLKEFPEYNLHLPPKHFLSTGLDVPVIQERCKLLYEYLKRLMQLPNVSGSIEVWDFLSVDSQTYVFSNSFSIIKTLSVDLNDKASAKAKASSLFGSVSNSLTSWREDSSSESKESALQPRNNIVLNGSKLNLKGGLHITQKKPSRESGRLHDSSGSDSDSGKQRGVSSPDKLGNTIKEKRNNSLRETSLLDSSDPMLPTEWVPPNLSTPILDLVDVIFQLQDGGWIRRKAFWVAKQILQLGMGDAFDDWLIDKIQLLRKGAVVASGIRRVEQLLWPNGIFITKHPNRRPPHSSLSQNLPCEGASSPRVNNEQQQEESRRAKFVYELMIDNAPPAIVGLVGRKEYEHCAKDLYFFLQSSVCLKQLAFDLLELLLLSAFPEMDCTFKQLHEEKHRFVEFK